MPVDDPEAAQTDRCGGKKRSHTGSHCQCIPPGTLGSQKKLSVHSIKNTGSNINVISLGEVGNYLIFEFHCFVNVETNAF